MMRKPENSEPEWIYPAYKQEWCDQITKEFNLHPVLSQVLASRGFKSLNDVHNFLYAKLPDLHDPQLFADMAKAVNRILKAIRNKENILIYGDNDVDGITGTALLTEFLKEIDLNAFYYIQNRSTTKSILLDALEFAKKNSCTLIITVDCGITAAKEVEEIAGQGVDVIITDHHEPTAKLPHCIATLNPKLHKSTYPNRDITGVGVAFKLVHALTSSLIGSGTISATKIDLKRYLDLVAMGTIADMGALVGENRIMVRYGLRQLRKTKRVGLTKLLDVCEIKKSDVTTMSIASKVAPRLNSLGRIADPQKGVELLLIRDPAAAEKLANELDLNNIERQKIDRNNSFDVQKKIANDPRILQRRAIVLDSSDWHPGIIPIITARIAKQYNRPTILISLENGIGKGSIRTIPEFPLLSVLHNLSKYFINFGGHDFAAGLAIEEKNIPAFREEFIVAAEKVITEKDIHPKLHLDAHVSFADLTYDFMDMMHLLEPFGTENPAPLLYCKANQIWSPKIVGKDHLKVYLEESERNLEGIGFNLAPKRPNIRSKKTSVEVAFTPQINTFLNKSSIQLQIRDIKPAV
ncbi:MAG: single-stranded-DNA-specific exonuclease RecJ [Candidatus Algichlamydia australiensis]|nr:single-stranded-DNA-specific exonuclease RecJ [Chlamydiales bacterium]